MILFITRKYPPSVGGMEKQSNELTTCIGKLSESHVISWGKSQVFLPLFFLLSFAKGFWLLLNKDIELIHLGDTLLSPLGYVLGVFFKTPVIATAHGLDVVWGRFRIYQRIIPCFLKRLSKIICVSEQTKQEVLARGIPDWKTTVIPNGIIIENYQPKQSDQFSASVKKHVESMINQDLNNKTILITVGRLVERKGVDHFIREILPGILTIKKEIVYFVVGEGSYRSTIEQSIKELNLHNHVFLFGRVDDNLLSSLYSIADVFVMPNIPVEGDMEGFGIAALEANLACLPVVASDLEGLKEAIKDKKNGFLVDINNTEKFVSTIINLIEDPSYREDFGAKGRQFVVSHFSWHDIGKRYLREFESVMKVTR